jgi:molybdenum cofactor sulfurtransferase
VKAQFEAGHICGDNKDIVEGLPTGAIRVSLGYMSNWDDVEVCVHIHFISTLSFYSDFLLAEFCRVC